MRVTSSWIGWVLAVLIVVQWGCAGSRKVSGKGRPETTREMEAVYNSLLTAPTFRWYTGKAKIRTTTPDMKFSATMHLRIVVDSIIWASVEKFGFEVGRALITPDSVFVIDRFNQEYSTYNLRDYLLDFGIALDFRELQNALMGRMVRLSEGSPICTREDALCVFAVKGSGGVEGTHWVSPDRPPRLVKSFFHDRDGRTLQLQNSDWQVLDKGIIAPFSRVILVDDLGEHTDIELSFQEIALEVPSTLPFNVPERYEHIH